MSLTDKDAIKAKLGIPSSDTSCDAALDVLAVEVSQRLLTLTGRSDGAKTGHVELLRHVQQGRPFHLELRPVEEVTAVEYRALGDTQWGPIGFDLLDPPKGELMVTGVLLGWPPMQPYPPAWKRSSMVRYPVVRVTYDVADGTLDTALQGIAAAWGGYLFDRESFGAATEQTVGRVIRALMASSMPAWVSAGVSSYIPSTVSYF